MQPMEQMITEGFSVWKECINLATLYEFVYNKHTFDLPNRGHDLNGVYYDEYCDNVEWANYWTDPLNDNQHVAEIRLRIDKIVGKFLVNPIFYHADVSVMTPLNSIIRPHVDTPHRHPPWNNKVNTTLGIQIAIPLHDVTENSGITAFLPNSRRKVWPIADCYKGKFDGEFLQKCVQPKVNFGDMLMWDSRVLHSQMPNITKTARYFLLMNYLEENIVESVMQYETPPTQFS